MRSYADYINRAKHRAVAAVRIFDDSCLARQFVPFYENGKRVRVRFSHGEELTGTIGVTTGWRPCFLLMRTSRSLGSPHTLDATDHVIAVKIGREYVEAT